MRLMIVGQLEGHVVAAGKIATSKGAKVLHADSTDRALVALRSGKGADLVMVEIKQDIAGFIQALHAEHIVVPVVACGIGTDSAPVVAAIRAGAREYVPLPPDAELIAAVLQAVAEEQTDFIAEDPEMLAC